jgi:hypothetical protein
VTYRILVTGSRTWTDDEMIYQSIARSARDHPGAVVVHGGARGADQLAGAAARRLGLGEEVHRANWEQAPRAAGILRNLAMVKLGADVCLAFIKARSTGATHCADAAELAGIAVHRYAV